MQHELHVQFSLLYFHSAHHHPTDQEQTMLQKIIKQMKNKQLLVADTRTSANETDGLMCVKSSHTNEALQSLLFCILFRESRKRLKKTTYSRKYPIDCIDLR